MASALILTTILASCLTAQQRQQPQPLRFEVAAIKPSRPGQLNSSSSGMPPPGGIFRLVNVPLKQWVERALSVSDYALKAPGWLDASRFDLEAKIPAGPRVSQKEISAMLLNLLVDRFAFKWHEQRGNVSGYELVQGKKLLLRPSDPSDPKQRSGRWSGRGLIGGHEMPMSDLATALGDVLETPVVDGTQLSGGYEVELAWRPDDDAAALVIAKRMNVGVDDLPSTVFTAVQEQLGLRLQRAQVPLRVIVVDNISRDPTPN